MLSIAVRYVAALAVLVVGDILWLGYFAHAVFQPTLRPDPARRDRLARGDSCSIFSTPSASPCSQSRPRSPIDRHGSHLATACCSAFLPT